MRCLLRLVLVTLLLAAIAAGGAFWWARRSVLETPYGSYDAGPKAVQIEAGSSARQIFEQLEGAGVISNADLARAYFVGVLDAPALQAGEYSFDRPQTMHDAIDKVIRGDVVTHPVTLVEGLTAEETAVALADAGFGDLDAFRREVSSPERVLDLDPDATNLEGYLFPDTYRFATGTRESEIVSALVENFRRQVEAELAEHIPTSGWSLRELVVLASIIEKEAQLDEERTTISAVYNNRLRRGIALYADPTIIYALKLAGTWDGDIRRKDLSVESPYNTYRVAGLPPGPICSPGIASLVAAATPADVPYLYFVSRNDGSHVFAETLTEHNRNVYEWQKLYWRQRRAAERKSASDERPDSTSSKAGDAPSTP